MRIIVDVPDLQPERASCYTVASYVRAVLKLGALHQELANAVLEVPTTRPGCYEVPVRGTDQRAAQVVRILGGEREGEALRGGEGHRADSMIAAIYERLIEQAKRELARLER